MDGVGAVAGRAGWWLAGRLGRACGCLAAAFDAAGASVARRLASCSGGLGRDHVVTCVAWRRRPAAGVAARGGLGTGSVGAAAAIARVGAGGAANRASTPGLGAGALSDPTAGR
jgi:hypothetical protein